MSYSEAIIANLALANLGVSKAIASLAERSAEARACNQWYEHCRDETLRAAKWSFALTTADLALVAETPDGPEWRYSYAYPVDALRLIRLPYGSTRNPTNATITKYVIRRGASGGRVLFTDQDVATVEYIVQVTDPGEFPPDFVTALAYLVASRICPQVTSENRKENTLLMLQLYKSALALAEMNGAAEETPDVQPESDFITARD